MDRVEPPLLVFILMTNAPTCEGVVAGVGVGVGVISINPQIIFALKIPKLASSVGVTVGVGVVVGVSPVSVDEGVGVGVGVISFPMYAKILP